MFTIQFEFWIYYKFLINDAILFIFLLPLLIIIMYISIVVISLIFAKILLWGVNLIHKPRVGTFLRDKSDKNYCYWCIRNTIKKWPTWLSHKFPFPFLDNLCFKMFGVKTTFSNSLFEGWVDTEFIEFGKNVVVGQGSHIQSAVIMGNLLIIRKTIIEDDVRIGTHSVVMPGTHIGKKVALSTWSLTTIGQELEERWIYHGCPAKKFKKNRFFEDGLEDKIQFKAETEERLEEVYKKYYRKHQEEHVSYIEQLKPPSERED